MTYTAVGVPRYLANAVWEPLVLYITLKKSRVHNNRHSKSISTHIIITPDTRQ